MKKITLISLLLLFNLNFIFAQAIFDSSIHTATPFGSVNSPGGEGVQNIIDQNSATKFLDFNAFDGIGFEVDLLGVAQTASSIEIVTANDAPERDPTDYEIFGSNNGTDFTSITTGTIPCVSDRFFSRTFSFSNATAYSYYRINFTGVCGSSSINQIADVQLYGIIGTAPVLNCPGDIAINNDAGQCTGNTSFAVTANDAEDGSLTPTLTNGLDSGSDFPLGVTTNIYSVTDSDGNTVSCTFTVTVSDNEDPTIGCPADIMTETNPGETTAVVDYTVSASDNCSTINPLTDFTPLGTLAGKAYYLSNNAFTPQDAYTDALTQNGFVGTIRDANDGSFLLNAIAMIGGSGDILIGYSDTDTEGTFVWQSGDSATYTNWNGGEPNNAGNEDYTVMQSSGGWNDVVGASGSYRYLLEVDYLPEQTEGLASGSDFPIGTTTNTFIVTDIAGNFVTCSFDVVVSENLSVEDFELENNISLTPNPVDHILTIKNSSNLVLEHANIYDIRGRLVTTVNFVHQTIEDKTLNTSGLVSGFYLIEIKASNGDTTVKRFIKK
ncbi:HYR domain-containing protein [uncultured Psychroserpens sp.]|uniref:HYR domain-containing protein n=1 Tax=uncultured Psychroserpens sp. TaxID=255436 RepID=UPI0026046BB7|nr:HYR domain-containing protein [uncultured Psychroserpens sp.]